LTDTGGTGTNTLSVLHRIVAHVLARRRFEVSGRFGLRASPGGIVTPAFGDEPETVRLSGSFLLRETGGTISCRAIPGSSLRELAVFAGTDIDAPFSCGDDTPAIGEPDVPLTLDAGSVRRLADWYALGWVALDTVIGSLAPEAEPATIQLWPEHLDAATNVGVGGGGGGGERVNLGFSPGDAFESEPYAYVGPWSAQRHGDPDYWNAPFGAVLRASDVAASGDSLATCIQFLLAGIENAASAS
jgi:hypothetical protein